MSNGAMAIKLDISKAYDRVEWRFINNIMQKMGFCDKWHSWIYECISSVNYLVLINGVVTESFMPSRGLRKGYPLSPYLFLLCIEGFNVMLHKCVHVGTLHAQRISRNSHAIAHLLFVDDSLIFLDASSNDTRQLRQVLEAYELGMG